jgi:site-specific DNA recombinase
MKLAGYARVSTKEQAEGYSLDAQDTLIRKWASEQGHEVVAMFVERGKSARTDKRPEFQRAIKFVLADGADGILVHKSDRFARNLLDSLTYRNLFTKHNKVMFSVTEGLLNDDDPANKLIFHVVGAISEYVSDNIGREVVKGRNQKAESGSWPYGGLLPLGYKREDKKIVHEQRTAQFIHTAFSEFATGKYTLRSWADKAFELGMVNLSGQKIRPASWGATFRNVFYTGKFIWEGEVVGGDHPPIIDQKTFDEVQAILDARDSGGAVNRHFWLLGGLLWLDGLNLAMQGSIAKGRYSYYRAKEVYIKADEMEDRVEELLGRAIGHSQHAPDALKLALQVAPNLRCVYRLMLSNKAKRDFLRLVFKENGLVVNQGGAIQSVRFNDGFDFISPSPYNGHV